MNNKTVEILSSILYENLNTIYSVIDGKQIISILEDFLFEFKNGLLKITSSNLQTTLSTTINIENDSDFKIAVPAKILIATLKNFTNQPIQLCFDCDRNILKIKSKNGEYKIACESAECFPQVDLAIKSEKFEIEAESLINTIKNTIFIASNDTSKEAISALFFNFNNDRLTVVSTDIHRLIKFEQTIDNINKNFELLIPKKNISILANLLEIKEKAFLFFDEKYVRVQQGNFTWISTLITEKFPDYERVIPKKNANKMIINRENLFWSLKRLECFTSDLTLQIKFVISNNKLQIVADDTNFNNNAEEILDVFYEGDEGLTIAYNIRYLLEIIKNITSEEIVFLFSNVNENKISDGASIIFPEKEDFSKTIILVMPMML